jgi:hypothetical protein
LLCIVLTTPRDPLQRPAGGKIEFARGLLSHAHTLFGYNTGLEKIFGFGISPDTRVRFLYPSGYAAFASATADIEKRRFGSA